MKNISEMRNDGKSKFFQNVESVTVHTDCRKKYTSICRGKFTRPNFPILRAIKEDPSLNFTPTKKN